MITVFIIYCRATNYPKTLCFKTANINYLSFCESENKEWLNWVRWLRVFQTSVTILARVTVTSRAQRGWHFSYSGPSSSQSSTLYPVFFSLALITISSLRRCPVNKDLKDDLQIPGAKHPGRWNSRYKGEAETGVLKVIKKFSVCKMSEWIRESIEGDKIRKEGQIT